MDRILPSSRLGKGYILVLDLDATLISSEWLPTETASSAPISFPSNRFLSSYAPLLPSILPLTDRRVFGLVLGWGSSSWKRT